ncbi:RHS repeat-associated core domain-containing protein [Gemmatimonas sp.]|uniref:RHS repeat-associated core domain-containing protein n=1 Tax=Gemmatimonas sp. TaxID=1962908 RepID=UPI00286B11CF|nr:RHS repeat-associated core domain-containing protein [Gemmatimonas sp.]
MLYEVRTPVSSPTNDLAGGGTYGSFGRVAYLHGGGIDAPLAVTRFDEAGQPAVQTLAPHASWQGDYVDGTTMSGGAVATCTGASGCPRLEWRGGKETADGVATAPGDYPWWGRLVVGQLDGSGLKYQRNRFYDPLTGQFTQADPIGLAGGKNLYAFAGGDPVNYTDPFGLCPPVDKNTTDCSPEMKRLLAMDKPLESPLVDPVAIASGSITGLVRGTFVKAAIRVAETSASPGIAATTHGAMRLADPARLGTAGVRDAISNATRSFTQKDGAQVFAQQVGSRLNVVVQGERGVITTFRNLSDKSLARLAKNYGWEPK